MRPHSHSHIYLHDLYKQKFAVTIMTFTDMAIISPEQKPDMSMTQMMVIFWGFKPGSTACFLWNYRGICILPPSSAQWTLPQLEMEVTGRKECVSFIKRYNKFWPMHSHPLTSIHAHVRPSAGPANGHSWSSELHLAQFKPSPPVRIIQSFHRTHKLLPPTWL